MRALARSVVRRAACCAVAPSSLDNVAVGLTPEGKAGIGYHSDTWGAPCGGLLASADDMAKYMALYARRDGAAGGAQVVDGATLEELLQPVVQMRDGSSAVGLPWEFKYSNGLWYKSKQGGDPGYRSSLTLVDELGIGIFTSALTDPAGTEDSVWTIPAADILARAVQAILWDHRPHPAVPNAKALVGAYYNGWSVWVGPGSTLQASGRSRMLQ